MIARYRARISGPLLDRLDLQVEVPGLTFEEISAPRGGEPTGNVRARVRAAWRRQVARAGRLNGQLPPRELRRLTRLAPPARDVLARAVDRLGLSARSHDRVLRLALTITDLAAGGDDGGRASADPDGSGPLTLSVETVAEALSYRTLERTEIQSVVLAPEPGAAVTRATTSRGTRGARP